MEFSRYQEACMHFLENLIQGLIEDFDLPKESVQIFPVLVKPDPEKKYTVREAMLLAQDRFWHIGIQITLVCKTCETDPVQPILINLGVKKDKNFFRLKTSSEKEPFKISEATPENLKFFYDDIFDLIKGYLGSSIHVLLENEHTVCRIGFQRDCE